MTYNITPVPKPRQTQSDKWKQRPAIMKYRAFADECRYKKVKFGSGDHVIFVIPMPASWSKKKKKIYGTQPHRQKPDLDNLIKALGDSLYEDDSILYSYTATKVWGYEGKIIIDKQLKDR